MYAFMEHFKNCTYTYNFFRYYIYISQFSDGNLNGMCDSGACVDKNAECNANDMCMCRDGWDNIGNQCIQSRLLYLLLPIAKKSNLSGFNRGYWETTPKFDK